MKKIMIVVVVLFTISATTTAVKAQLIEKNALGVRIGDSDGFGGEISYQRALSDNNRLEFDLGWRDSNDTNAFKILGLYQWVMEIENRFNWYVGAGAGFGSFDSEDDNGVFALIAGDLGIEYNFKIPLLISLDFRPELSFNDNYSDGLDFDIGLGLRYQF